MLGNTKKVENTKLKSLFITQELKLLSRNKSFTRHYTNVCYYLDPGDYVLFSFLVYFTDMANVFTYSTKLLDQYDKATDMAIDIYKPSRVHYKTSTTNARNSFISLIEKGLIIRLSKKNQFMINPYLVYNSNNRIFNPKFYHNAYIQIVKNYSGEELSKELTKFCDGIQDKFIQELKRTNINLRKKNEMQNNNTSK